MYLVTLNMVLYSHEGQWPRKGMPCCFWPIHAATVAGEVFDEANKPLTQMDFRHFLFKKAVLLLFEICAPRNAKEHKPEGFQHSYKVASSPTELSCVLLSPMPKYRSLSLLSSSVAFSWPQYADRGHIYCSIM